MSGPLILIVGAIYLAISVDLFMNAKPGLAIAFGGYALSNIGLWLAL